MVAAKYPNVKDEETSVHFIINGLRKYPTLPPILGHLLAHKPQTIREFTRAFKSLHGLYQLQLPKSTMQTNFTRFTGDYAQVSKDYTNRPNYGRQPPNIRRIPINQLCSHHKALGIRCGHTDAQCRDQGHLKYQNIKFEFKLKHTSCAQNRSLNNHSVSLTTPFRSYHSNTNKTANLFRSCQKPIQTSLV